MGGTVVLSEKDDVLYMDAALIDTATTDPPGAACAKCMMFIGDLSACAILKPPGVDPAGVCGLFVGGPSVESSDGHQPMELVPAKVAGYTEDGPTMCGNCANFIRPERCHVVKGRVEAGGCCNAWRRARGGYDGAR